jgi:hypothetical protein
MLNLSYKAGKKTPAEQANAGNNTNNALGYYAAGAWVKVGK